MGLIRFVKKFFVLFPLLLTFTSSIPSKVCQGDLRVDSSNIDSFKDCTKINGHLNIRNETFTGEGRVPEMDPSKLEVFSTVSEISGSLHVRASHPDFTDLHYLRNLQMIGGQGKAYPSGVYIEGTSLKSLGLRSLKMIGTVFIRNNNNLCFAEGINWHKLKRKNTNFFVDSNRPKHACVAENMVCHNECSEDGCWGPGADVCLSCKRFSLHGLTCVDSCSHPGIYQSGDKTCGKCHEECDGPCTGMGPYECVKCKHVKYRWECVASCPLMTYKTIGDCVQCNEKCVYGCTGPGNFFGPGGCNKVIVVDNKPNQTNAWVRVLKTDETCKEGNFSELVNVTGTTKSWKCRPCHPSCKNCTGYGFHLSVCNECARFRSEEQCEDRCPIEYYADYTTMRCIRCSSECKGCWGPRSDQCESCRNLKVPLGEDITHEFNCSDTCPEDKPQTRQDQGGRPYCWVKDPVEEISISAISGVVVACIFLIGVIAAAYRYRCWQRTCLRGNTDRMGTEKARREESYPLNTAHADPNHAQLTIDKEPELCGESIPDPVCATD